jgi:uncharacterized protein (TIGR02246 family)
MTEKTVSGVARIERPEDGAKVFLDRLNAGDLDGLVSLFEPDAVLVPAPGQVATGSDALRETFAGFLATGVRLELTKRFSLHRVGDIALSTVEFKLEGTDPDGNPLTVRTRPVVVFRRQADGSWRFLIDNGFPFE